jgi:hypothetical protein
MARWGISLLCALALAAFTLSGCGEDDGGATCVPTGTTETVCNDNIDNDCDGTVDLNDSDCQNTCTPVGETCNGVDDDCDGLIDEALTQPCTEGGQAGVQTCSAGAWGACVVDAPPPVELCDNADNDGDGQVDEDLQQVCNTACGSGVERCVAGQWVGCDAPRPQTEVCDGRDNNCDGSIDEGLTRACENACGTGTETCSLGNWFGCTAPRPGVEACDNVDNDCDGATDEEVTKTCTTTCGEGVQICAAGQWGACSARQPAAAEVCDNNVDDDCDGQTDEGCGGCTPGTSAGCVGINVQTQLCAQGTQVCGPNSEWGACQVGAVTLAAPVVEVCNGRDDDCDGGVDESFARMGQACGGGPGNAPLDTGECQSGTWACTGAAEVCQGMIPPATELCDGLDNDCDGATDNNLAGDLYEANEQCAQAENIGTIAEASDPRTWTATMYPSTDIDYFFVTVEERTTWCVPFTGPADKAYEVIVALYNLPQGVDYDLCVQVAWAVDRPQDFCGEELLIDECVTIDDDSDGEKLFAYEVEPSCMLNDDTSVLIKVVPHAGSPVSCQPYTVSIWANTVEAK